MAEHNIVGQKGEEIAAKYLLKKGHVILATNWRWLKSEIDIVTKHASQLVFVEVKTRKTGALDNPENAVNRKKQRQLTLGANAYIAAFEIELECRFDVISICIEGDKVELKHFVDAFCPIP